MKSLGETNSLGYVKVCYGDGRRVQMGNNWFTSGCFISRLIVHLFVSVGYGLLVDFYDPERGTIRCYEVWYPGGHTYVSCEYGDATSVMRTSSGIFMIHLSLHPGRIGDFYRGRKRRVKNLLFRLGKKSGPETKREREPVKCQRETV